MGNYLRGSGISFLVSTIIFVIYLFILGSKYFFGDLLLLLIYLFPFNYLGCLTGEILFLSILKITNKNKFINYLLFGLLGYMYGIFLTLNIPSSSFFKYTIFLSTMIGSIAFYLGRSIEMNKRSSYLVTISAPFLLVILFIIVNVL
jgi:hypothetical protein